MRLYVVPVVFFFIRSLVKKLNRFSKMLRVMCVLAFRYKNLNLLSAHLSAAAVSVVKKGFPVPAAKMTTLPFSRCRTALLRMYGSATSDIRNAVCTLVGIPMLSIVACKNIAFITVANILWSSSKKRHFN